MSGAGSQLDVRDLQQGDRLMLRQALFLPSRPDVEVLEVVVVSQTCDVVQVTRGSVAVAPLERVAEGLHLDAARGKRPLVLAYPSDEGDTVVLLEHATAVEKSALLGFQRIGSLPGGPADFAARDFARRVGAVYSRFPVPDEVVPALKPLTDVIRREAPRDKSIGRGLSKIREIRIESSNGWSGPTFDLRLYLIMDSACLVPQDLLEGLESTESVLDAGHRRDVESMRLSEVCQLLDTEQDDVLRALGCDRLAELFEERVAADGVVTGCVVEAISEDDFTYRQYRVTESLNFESMSVSGSAV